MLSAIDDLIINLDIDIIPVQGTNSEDKKTFDRIFGKASLVQCKIFVFQKFRRD